ncbi:unnamed protein product [Dibothriocephalus latus]|uniref:EGF-like domain-containing protein n=1 Tax=Dibothriocephalus latus TaxID=60516 RepID=A0A3P7NTW4_DIBLA|nr:unnamed protein product [Dibothriocephalus latus]
MGRMIETSCQIRITCYNSSRLPSLGDTLRVYASYEGRLCETDINECSGSPCQNNGQCEDLIGGFRCHCVRGWKGEFCELRELPCDSQPCLNNGTCEHRSGASGDASNDYFCRCPPGKFLAFGIELYRARFHLSGALLVVFRVGIFAISR